MAVQYGDVILTWLGHDGFEIKGTQATLYIDPYQINPKTKPIADYLLITHSHYDHLSTPDIEPLVNKNTLIICARDCEEKLAKFPHKRIHALAPGEVFEDERVHITAVPAYNNEKPFHPRENEWLGFVVRLDKIAIYHAGDTDLIPEMKSIDCTVALLPVSGTYVMNAEEAAEAADLIEPEVAIPMHWGAIIGERGDAETFKKNTKTKTVILEREP
jgi:L-ascorbate metabolism protein UlaG (beta-lactamase superfamily)